MNVFFVGDELVAGHGDPKALGWVGRVAARTIALSPELKFHTLAVPGETSGQLVERWDSEALRRVGSSNLSTTQNAVLFAIGRHDAYQDVPLTRTRLNLADAIDKAHDLGFRVLLAGPPPGQAHQNLAISELAGVCAEAAARRKVAYIDMYGPLVRHDQWITDVDSNSAALPQQAGYGLMAWLVLHSHWHNWLGLPQA